MSIFGEIIGKVTQFLAALGLGIVSWMIIIGKLKPYLSKLSSLFRKLFGVILIVSGGFKLLDEDGDKVSGTLEVLLGTLLLFKNRLGALAAKLISPVALLYGFYETLKYINDELPSSNEMIENINEALEDMPAPLRLVAQGFAFWIVYAKRLTEALTDIYDMAKELWELDAFGIRSLLEKKPTEHLASFFEGFTKRKAIKKVPSFQYGGIVPGHGPIPIMAHGGERILPAGTAPVTYSPVINISASIASGIDMDELARKISDQGISDLRRLMLR